MAWSTNQKARHKAAYHPLWLTAKAGWTLSIERPNRGFSKLSLDSLLQHEFLLEFPAWHLCNLQPLQFLHACSLNQISFSLLSNVDIIWQECDHAVDIYIYENETSCVTTAGSKCVYSSRCPTFPSLLCTELGHVTRSDHRTLWHGDASELSCERPALWNWAVHIQETHPHGRESIRPWSNLL